VIASEPPYVSLAYNLKEILKEITNLAIEYPEIAESMRQAIEGSRKNVVPGS
jgi:hypothetical protein